MLRRFAPGYERPSPDQARSWHIGKMFDDEGMPVDVETGLIVQPFVERPDATISAMIISRRTKLDPFLVRSYCRQLCNPCCDVLEESPPLSACFTLNTHATDAPTQDLLEKIRRACSRFQ